MDTQTNENSDQPDPMLRHAAELFSVIGSDANAAESIITQMICDLTSTDEVLGAQLMGLQALLQRIGTTSDRAADGLSGSVVRSSDMWLHDQGSAAEALAAMRRLGSGR